MLKKLTDSVPDIDITSSPTTVIYQNIVGLPDNILAKDGTAAIRIVQDNFCKQLIERFGKPIISTSANTDEEALALLKGFNFPFGN